MKVNNIELWTLTYNLYDRFCRIVNQLILLTPVDYDVDNKQDYLYFNLCKLKEMLIDKYNQALVSVDEEDINQPFVETQITYIEEQLKLVLEDIRKVKQHCKEQNN